MKTYGKEPESLESITRIFQKDLGHYPTEKILKAIAVHSQRSAEFPTVADISLLIVRNGKPPIKESDVIAIRKKEGEFRTPGEWQMLRDWDAQQSRGWDGEVVIDERSHEANAMENERLRGKVIELEKEVSRLTELLHKERVMKGVEKPRMSAQERIAKTVEGMRLSGAPQEAIDLFLADPYCGYNA